MLKTPFSQADAILNFYKTLQPGFDLPKGVSMKNPFEDDSSWRLVQKFYRQFYQDDRPRVFIFGINPGRFGGGVTGIPFTDPIRLQDQCGIANDFRKLPELSSLFIYSMIESYGGPSLFYQHFFITALSPLGFVRDGKNLNYYDDRDLLKACEPFILHSIRLQIQTIRTDNYCYCLGEGKNFQCFSQLNQKFGLFKKIFPLPHPRWIMQYRRKRMDEFVALYMGAFKEGNTSYSQFTGSIPSA